MLCESILLQARDVGEKAMNSHTSTWSLAQFATQAGVNVLIIAASAIFNLGSVHTAMVSQALTLLFCVVYLTAGWHLLPKRPRKHKLPEGHSLTLAGFRQNCETFKKIWRNYKVGLRWFLISTIFGEAAASAVGSTAVVFLNGNIGLSALQIGIFFEISLFGVMIGTKVSENHSLSICRTLVWYFYFILLT